MSVDITALSIQVTSTGIREASNQLGGLSTSAANTERRISALIETMKRLQSVGGTLNIVSGSSAALTAALTALNNTLGLLNQRTTQADQSQRRHNEGMREAHGLARGLSGSLGALWLTYGNLVGMMAGLAIGSGLKAILVMGKDVEHVLEGIRVKGMESVDSINKLRDSILDLGSGVFGAQEVAKAFDILVMAGLNAQQALVAMKDALNLAIIGGTTVEKAAFTLVQVGTALGYTAEGYSRIGDVIAKTAAVSMSSVESLSEAFKSGSVVGKLYGASIVDIGVAFAALSNLGIKGSAAGTSLKNMYKELAADSDKLKNTLNLIGLKPQNLKDIEGNFLPMVQLFSTLDGALSKYTAAEQKTLLARMANERGMKSLVEILDLYRQKVKGAAGGTEEFTRELEQMSKAIDESYGFVAQGAAAMALTVDSQFKSVKNTLEVSLIKAFQNIQPEMSLVARKLKEVFSSTEFITAVGTLATGVAKFTVMIVENASALGDLLKVILAYKAAMMIAGVLSGIGAALLVMEKALIAARAAALAFQVSLGVLGIALAIGTVLISRWLDKKSEIGQDDSSRAAISYVEDFTNKLRENTAQIRDQITAMVNGTTAAEAYVDAQNKVQLQKVKEQNQSIVGSANESRGEVYASFDSSQKLAIQNMLNGKRPEQTDYKAIDAINRYKAALDNLFAAQRKAKQLDEEATTALQENIQANKVAAEIADRQAAEKNRMPGGTETIEVTKNKAKEADALQGTLNTLQKEIAAARKLADQEKLTAQSQYKTGALGEIGLIQAIEAAEIKKQNSIAASAQSKIDSMRGVANQESARATALAEIEATKDAKVAAEATRLNSLAELESNTARATLKFEAEKFEKMGQYKKAYEKEFEADYTVKLKRLQDNIDKETDITKRGAFEKAKAEAKATYDAGVGSAANRDAVNAFNIEVENVRNALKSVQTSTEGQGLAAMFDAATVASAKYKAALVELEQKKGITDPKGIVEAQANLNNLAENQRKMWVGVGESISNSLESAFGAGGKAAGDLLKIAVNYNNLEKKTSGARIKAYGDAAGAAKGFFKEGTTGYKVLETVEKGFRLVQLAGIAKSLYADLAASTAKATGKIPAVIMEFMSQMGPWGLAAAGVAIAGVLGGAFGGGSGASSSDQRQKTQGTGSVLGSDEKSNSIANSIEILAKNSGLGLAQGNSMVNYLKSVSDNIKALASLVVRTTGISGNTAADTSKFNVPSIIGGKYLSKALNSVFGGSTSVTDTGFSLNKTTVGGAMNGVNAGQYTDTKKDGGWFHSDKNSTATKSLGADANLQFSNIIKDMSKSINQAATSLGMGGDEFSKRLSSFVVDIGKISLKGMNGQQVQEALQGVFSKLGDDMSRFAIVGLEKFQQVGEGYLETVVRVANSLGQVKDVFAALGKTFDLTGLAAITVSEGLIAAAGGLDKLTEGTKFFVDNFLTEAEKMGPITDSVTKRLKELGVSELTTVELYKKKIRALDLTNAEDQKLYANLIELAPVFKEAADYADKLAEGTVSLTKAQQKALDNIEKARTNLQKAYDSESNALQSTIDKTKSYVQTLKDFQNSLKLGANSPLTNMEKYAEAKSQFNTVGAAAQGGDAIAQQKFTSIANEFLNASRVVNASGDAFTADFNRVQTMTGSLVDAAVGQIDVATASLAALNKQVEGLLNIDKSVMSVTQAITELRLAIEAGRTAGIDATGVPIVVPVAPTQSGPTAAQFADAMVVLHGVQAAIVDLKVSGQAVGATLAEVVMDSSQENADTTVAGFKNTKTNSLTYA